MRTPLRILMVAVTVFGFVTAAHAWGTPDADSTTLTASCTGWPSPRVNLSWYLPAHRHVNNIEKAPQPGYQGGAGSWWGFISDPGYGEPNWGQAPVSWGDTSYVDTNIAAGSTYHWRIKTGAGVPSNEYVVTVNSCNCGGGCPPSDNASVTVSAPGTADSGQRFFVTFIAANTGTTTWDTPTYSMNATDPANSSFWSAPASAPSVLVTPPGFLLRTLTFTAPTSPGTYPIAPWRMSKSGPGFFGTASPTAMVTVVTPNQPATGQHETTTCGALTGWAKDPDTAAALAVRIYQDGPMGVGTLAASLTANGTHAAPYNGYGYSWVPPKDGVSHTYHVYALDPQNSIWYPLVGSPSATLACWPIPSVTMTSVIQGDYCSGGPQATANWQYTSAGSLPQTQWQLQVATNPGFAALVYDSGVKPSAPTTPPPSTHSTSTGPGVLQFGTTYWFRVRAWDSQSQASAWSAPLTTTTPASAYPVAAFSYAPPQVFAGQEVQFTDASGNGPIGWLWNFGDGQLGSGPNPTHTYATQGAFTVKLDVTNAAGTCSTTQMLNANKPLPSFREVRPGQ